ncbi:MAG: hypothetical protein NT062_12280, partial [Proteobacteria bacterium]|nr:hypothetical protein [Pseudomonadota bacterium]
MRHLLLLTLLALPALTACWEDDRPIAWDRARTVLGPIPLKTQVAYVDSALDRVTLIDLADDAPVIHHSQVGRRAAYAIPSPDRHKLFVITRGEEAVHPGEIDQPPLFWVVNTDEPTASPIAYSIGSPFDRVAVSPDGNTAIAYFSAAGPDEEGFFRNPNELAIVDLAKAPEDGANPVLETIRSFGSVPEGISLSPPMSIAGALDPDPRTFAFILSSNNLTILDVAHPTRREITIRLDLGGQPVIPREVVFAPNTASAYVRSDNARDVLQVILTPDPPARADANDFRPVLAELGAGGGPTDIAVYDNAAGKRYLLAATPNTGELVVIDADTAQFRSIPLADPIDRIVLFPTSATETLVPHQALLASIGAKLSRVHVLDLDALEDPLTQVRIEKIELDKPVRDVVPVPDRDMAMLVHDDARTVLGLLDIETRSTSPLLGVGKLDTYDFSPDGSHLIGATKNVSRVGFLALDNLHPTDFRLDDLPVRVLSTANGKIFVDHGQPLGHATIIPSPKATRGEATVLAG